LEVALTLIKYANQMLGRINTIFLSEKFFAHVCVYFIGSNEYDCNHRGSSSSNFYAGDINRYSQYNNCRNRQQQ
jgi:hypothetical protein